MNRKKFLNVTGTSVAGMTLLNQLPASALATVLDSKGAAMIEIKTKRLVLAHTWTISRNSSDYKDNVFVKMAKRHPTYATGKMPERLPIASKACGT